jgi:tetratricopeptide (TPR) repeat protein
MSSYIHGSGISYKAYLQAKEFVDDIRWDISRTNLNLIATNEALQENGLRLEHSINELQETVVEGLGTLDASINELSAKFDWGIARLEAALGGINDSLSDLVRLVGSPERTWAYEQFDMARDAFRRGLFPEALEYIERAINGDQHHTGYKIEHRFHHFLGIVRRGDYKNTSPDIVDLEKAERAYVNASRYAEADHKSDAARALCGAGWVAYCQGKIDVSETYTRRSLQFAKTGEANYQLSKLLMHRNSVQAGLERLADAIQTDPLYGIRCFDDPDFQRHEPSVGDEIGRQRTLFISTCKKVSETSDKTLRSLSQLYDSYYEINAKILASVSSNYSPISLFREQLPRALTLLDSIKTVSSSTPYLDAAHASNMRGELFNCILYLLDRFDREVDIYKRSSPRAAEIGKVIKAKITGLGPIRARPGGLPVPPSMIGTYNRLYDEHIGLI